MNPTACVALALVGWMVWATFGMTVRELLGILTATLVLGALLIAHAIRRHQLRRNPFAMTDITGAEERRAAQQHEVLATVPLMIGAFAAIGSFLFDRLDLVLVSLVAGVVTRQIARRIRPTRREP